MKTKNVLRQNSLPSLIRQISSLQKHDKNGKLYIYTYINTPRFDKLHSDREYMVFVFLF